MAHHVHTTVAGHRIEYEAPPKVTAFLRRLEAMLGDRKVTEQQMIGLAYSSENPFLDQTMFPGRGAVTKDVLADPVYSVMTDILFRKHVAQDGVDLEKLAAKYSMTVAEAAAELGIHESAVRQAIAAKRLASWVKDGRHYIDPRSLTSFEAGTRGPKARGAKLTVCMGNEPGSSLSVRAPGELVAIEKVGANMKRAELPAGWRRLVVRATEADVKRTWVLSPGTVEEAIRAGRFYVIGRFSIDESANTSKKAEALWRSTSPA